MSLAYKRKAITLIAMTLALALSLPALASSNTMPQTPIPARSVTPLDPGESMSYSELIQAMQKRQIAEAVVAAERGRARIVFKKRFQKKDSPDSYTVAIPVNDANLIRKLDASGAKVTLQDNIQPESSGGAGAVLIPLIIIAFMVIMTGLMIFMANRRSRALSDKLGEAKGRKKKHAKEVADDDRPQVSFSDVAGCDEAIREVSEFLLFLKNPEPFQSVGAKMPRGIILHGPPGTGKTLLAKALAGESGCGFFAISGSEFVERYVGVGASRVRELFAKARKSESGAVIFIDEIDAIGKARGSGGVHGANDEREQTLNQLLVEMDGFNSDDRIIVVAATNRVDTLDKALLRPGRLSRQVHVDLPARDGRKAILEVHSKGKPLDDDVDIDELAEYTAGASGADLANMLNEAAIMAAREKRLTITSADLKEGHLRAIAGPEKEDSMMLDEEREVVAFHEAGHVLCAELCPEHDKAQRATIKPRGRAAGMAIYSRKDRALQSADLIHQSLVVALGGRAAEATIFGRVTSGAANDLQIANDLARKAVEELGFSPHAGQLVQVRHEGFSDSTKTILDNEVERLVAEAYNEALDLLSAEREALERLADKLLEAEDIDRLEICAALSGEEVARPRGPKKMQPIRRKQEEEVELEVEVENNLPKRARQLAGSLSSFLTRLPRSERLGRKKSKQKLADAE